MMLSMFLSASQFPHPGLVISKDLLGWSPRALTTCSLEHNHTPCSPLLARARTASHHFCYLADICFGPQSNYLLN